jgi:hypothetical protein
LSEEAGWCLRLNQLVIRDGGTGESGCRRDLQYNRFSPGGAWRWAAKCGRLNCGRPL